MFAKLTQHFYQRESSSPTLEQVLLMGCQRGHDGQGTSPTESDLSMLSSSGISSVESSLSELMVKNGLKCLVLE